MTENENLRALRKDFTEVRSEVIDLGKNVAGMSEKLDSVCSSVKAHGDAIRALEIADATGAIEIAKQRKDSRHPPSRSIVLLPLLLRVLPWVAVALIGIGVHLGNRGNEEQTTRALEQMIRLTSQLQQQSGDIGQAIDDLSSVDPEN